MSSVAVRFLFLMMITFLLSSCRKDETSDDSSKIESLKVFADDSIKWACGSVAGDGVVLLVYVDFADQYKFKLIDNNGNEIWTKTFGYIYDKENYVDFHVIYDVGNTFSIFFAKGLKRINPLGEVVYNNNNFLAPLNSASVYKIILTNNNSYLCLGTFNSRALVSELSSTGTLRFSRLYVINVNGPNIFTSAVIDPLGGYLVGGAFSSNTVGLESAFFLMRLKANGDIVYTKKTNMDSCTCQGRELIEISENQYAFLVSPNEFNSTESRSRLYFINDTASILKMEYLDLAENNYGPGYNPYSGNGLIKSSSNKLMGIMKADYEVSSNASLNAGIIRNYKNPQFDYFYTWNMDDNNFSQSFLSKTYSSFYSSIVNMSNGKALIFGTTMSLGDELKLMVIEK